MCLFTSTHSKVCVCVCVCVPQVDLWQPNSASLIRHNATVDMHVKLNDTQGLHAHLKQEGIAYK